MQCYPSGKLSKICCLQRSLNIYLFVVVFKKGLTMWLSQPIVEPKWSIFTLKMPGWLTSSSVIRKSEPLWKNHIHFTCDHKIVRCDDIRICDFKGAYALKQYGNSNKHVASCEQCVITCIKELFMWENHVYPIFIIYNDFFLWKHAQHGEKLIWENK